MPVFCDGVLVDDIYIEAIPFSEILDGVANVPSMIYAGVLVCEVEVSCHRLSIDLVAEEEEGNTFLRALD